MGGMSRQRSLHHRLHLIDGGLLRTGQATAQQGDDDERCDPGHGILYAPPKVGIRRELRVTIITNDGIGSTGADTAWMDRALERTTFGASSFIMAPIEQLSTEVDAWITSTGVRYFGPLTNMAILSEEVGEVARIMARRHGEQSEKPTDRGADLGEELADVLFVVLCLANQTGTDLQEAWTKKMRKRTSRDRSRHKANPKLR